MASFKVARTIYPSFYKSVFSHLALSIVIAINQRIAELREGGGYDGIFLEIARVNLDTYTLAI